MMSTPVANSPQAEEPGMLMRLGLNSIIVWLVLVTASLTVHALGNNLGAFLDFFNGNSIAVFVLFGVVFSYTYDKVSGLWSPGPKRKVISLFSDGLENSGKRHYSIRLFDTIGFGVGLAIIFWGVRYMAIGGLLGDTDGEGIADSADGVAVGILVLCAVALESGGRTESDDDEDDKTSPTTASPGG